MIYRETIYKIETKNAKRLDILMFIIILIFSIIFSTTIFSQNYQTEEEVDNICSQLGFSSDEEAQIAVDKILNERFPS